MFKLFIIGCVAWMLISTYQVEERLNFHKEVKTSINVYETTIGNLNKYGIRFPEVFVAQILHETAGLNSLVYTNCNNLIGMKHNSRGYSKGICRGHARYTTKIDCFKDYKAYQDKYLTYYEQKIVRRKITTNKEYIRFLYWIGYAEDPLYETKLLNWMHKIKAAKIELKDMQSLNL